MQERQEKGGFRTVGGVVKTGCYVTEQTLGVAEMVASGLFESASVFDDAMTNLHIEAAINNVARLEEIIQSAMKKGVPEKNARAIMTQILARKRR